MSKSIHTKTDTIFTITYNNGIICNYTLSFDIIKNEEKLFYHFKTDNNNSLTYISNKEELLDILPYYHSENYKDITLHTVEELENFTDFNNLVSLHGSLDGTLRDYKGNVISTMLHYDGTFCSIYLRIDTEEKVQECYEHLLNHSYVKDIKKIDIPYYNVNKPDHDKTIQMTIKLPSDIYQKYCGNEYVNDQIKIKIFKEVLIFKV